MPRILIVDDSAMHRELGAILLTQDGHTILEAKSGLEAISMAQAELPDLILMDLSMPDMDGVTAMHRLRASDATRYIPMVAVTGYPERWARELITQGGFQGYIEKPFRPSTFVDDVLSHLCQMDHRLH